MALRYDAQVLERQASFLLSKKSEANSEAEKKPADPVDPAEVKRAADALQQAYGADALTQARRIQAEAVARQFAEAVAVEIERRLRSTKS